MNGECLDPEGHDNFDPDDPGDSGDNGGGQASSERSSTGSKSSLCSISGDTGDTASSSGTSETTSSGSCPVKYPKGTKVKVKSKARCGGACDTRNVTGCGPGCACTFAGNLFGALDGKCQTLAFWGGGRQIYDKPPVIDPGGN